MSAADGSLRIDLNADVGEGFDDAGIAESVSSLNIACGGHAGDERSMRAALALARDFGLAAGAHPGYPDREGFGRSELGLPSQAIAATVLRQTGELAALAREEGLHLAHVKPHGALYHRASRDAAVARAIASAISAIDSGLAVVAFPGSELAAAAEAAELSAIPEGFADRGYGADGALLPRSEPGAVLDAPHAARQAIGLARSVRTLCVHSDSPGAAATARAVRRALEATGAVVVPFAASWRVHSIPELHVVGAAIVERGRVLLTRRGPGRSMAGKWEFPGGKVEAEESAAEALAREIREELACEVEIGERIGRGTALHDGRRIVLEVYSARRTSGELELHEHEEHGWFAPEEIKGLDWPEADLPVLPALVGRLRAAASPR